MIVATYRDTDVDGRHPLTGALVELHRLRLADELRLGPLADTHAADLLGALLNGPPSPALVGAIQRQSEGNPFFIEELVRALASDGRLSPGANGWDMVPAAGQSDQSALPPGLRAWLWARLRRLTPACLTLLETAALLGRRIDPQLIVTAQGCDEPTAAVLLAEATHHQMLVARGDGYEFVHDLFRAALDQEIDPLRRRRLHEQAASGYEVLGLAESRPAALAYHLLRGARPARAQPYLIRAGERALASFAYHHAVEHFTAAASLIRQHHDADALVQVLPALGEALAGAGQYDAALEAYREALTLSGVAADAAQAGRIHTRIGQVYLAREEADLAAAAHQRAFAAFGGADHPEVARTLLQLSELNLMALSRHSDGADKAEQALAMAERLGRPDLAAEARGLLGMARVRMGTSGGVELMNRALADALDAHEPALAGTIANRLAHHHYWEAELDESARAAGQAVELLRGVADPHRLGWPTFWLGVAAFTRGQWNEAERRAVELTELGEQLGVRRFLAQAHQLHGMVAQDRGRRAEAIEHLGQARPAAGQLHWTLVARTVGELALARGDLECAAEYLDRSARIAARAGARPELARTWRALARLELARPRVGTQERGRAADLERQAQAVEQALGMPAPEAEVAARTSPTSIASPLSMRELEVLRLVADGLSNREIAARLIISERTVVHHVTHILDKLDVPSRAAAAAYGYRHGLLPNPTNGQARA